IKFQIRLATASLTEQVREESEEEGGAVTPAPELLATRQPDEIIAILRQKVMEVYRQREIEFPVRVGMAQFMSDRQQQQVAGGQRYDREGLLRWEIGRASCRERG